MRTSSFFGQLRSAYASEIDDMSFDSEGKNVLRQRLAARRKELPFLRQMMELSPEMVSVVFHQGFRFKNPALIEHVLSLESDEFPAWDTLSDAITLEPWAQQLADELCKEPMGEWLLTVAAGLEYLFAKPERASAKDHSEDDDEDGEKDEGGGHDGEDEEEKDARAREEAGQDWMVEQGFDRKD
ncbi:MAG: hypothetical protein QE279_00150 [Rhodoferax sp.]|nr:hypothetical protein [Rhodoferax sp.]